MKKIAIVGQGYIGLPLAISAANSDFYVYGIDIDELKINQLNSGQSPIEGLSNNEVKTVIDKARYIAVNNFEVINECEIVIICVPTPLNSYHVPDLTTFSNAVKVVGKHLTKGSLVVIESTIAPGTTRDLVLETLKKESKLSEKDFDLAFSPERIDPLNLKWNILNTPKIVSGLNEISLKRATEFYSKFVEKIIEVQSIEVAETAKVLENSFRLINISFINELAVFCNKLGIDINEVIIAASTKPYGFMPFYPSLGVGGHCIPVDPIYLSEKANQLGTPIQMIDVASKVNKNMPEYFVGRADEKIGGLKDKSIIILGVAYKPNVADVRETPVESLIMGLISRGAQVSWHDDLVKQWNGSKSVVLSSNYDLAIIATPHDYFDLSKLGNVPILNTRGSI